MPHSHSCAWCQACTCHVQLSSASLWLKTLQLLWPQLPVCAGWCGLSWFTSVVTQAHVVWPGLLPGYPLLWPGHGHTERATGVLPHLLPTVHHLAMPSCPCCTLELFGLCVLCCACALEAPAASMTCKHDLQRGLGLRPGHARATAPVIAQADAGWA